MLSHNANRSSQAAMSDTGKLARGRASTRPAAGIARNQSALLVNPLDPRHIVGIEEISGPGMMPAVRARVSFDGGASWRESWQLPVEPGWTAKEKEDWLSSFNYYTSDVVSIHEVYPGHYVQLSHAARASSLIRRVHQSGVYIEGWAVYGEMTMLNGRDSQNSSQ